MKIQYYKLWVFWEWFKSLISKEIIYKYFYSKIAADKKSKNFTQTYGITLSIILSQYY